MADTFLLLMLTIVVVCIFVILLSFAAESFKRWLVRGKR